MKKLLFFLLSLVLGVTAPVSANAQDRIGSYTYCGVEKPVGFNQEKQQVFIEAHDTGLGQLIYLKGEESIAGFRKSLIEMKEEYVAMKANANKVGKTKMSTSFEEFIVSWSSPSNDNTLGGICEGIHPVFQVTRNKKNNRLDSFAVIDERVKDISEGNGYAVLFLCFQTEDEIQSLIDVLSLCLDRLSSPSSSQNITNEIPQNTTTENTQIITEKNFWPADPRVFDYTKVNNIEIKGIISPSEIDKYNIMLIRCKAYHDGYYYIAIPNENICNVWISSLTGMKELFIKNDQIAKENDVLADISKFVSEKFNFEGFFVSLWNQNVYTINGGRWPIRIGVEYRYISGKSSMVLYMKQDDARHEHDEKDWTKICVFNSVQDFDTMINALTWENFMKGFNAQAQEIKQQQELEARKQREQALFD